MVQSDSASAKSGGLREKMNQTLRHFRFAAAALLLVAASGIANADQLVTSIRLDFQNPSQQPSTEEFLLAAKRVFYFHKIEFEVVPVYNASFPTTTLAYCPAAGAV